jgi:hypothetical protein
MGDFLFQKEMGETPACHTWAWAVQIGFCRGSSHFVVKFQFIETVQIDFFLKKKLP